MHGFITPRYMKSDCFNSIHIGTYFIDGIKYSF